jgi:hypothetical protein
MMRAARAASRGRSISTSTPMNEMYMVQASIFKFSIAVCRSPIAPFGVPAFQAAICRAKGAR